ncbi:MAG: hypothetical protein AAF447_16360 [Myxococcota bacterium]
MAFAAVVAATMTVAAEARGGTASAVDRARQGLQSYDLEGRTTTRLISELGDFVAAHRGEESPTLREARFMRSMAAADLVLLADHHGTPELVGRVAAAYGLAPGALLAQLDADLAALEIGVYAASARDARHALSLHAGARETTRERPRGARGDLLTLAAIREAAAAEEPLPALAALAEDPCPSGPWNDCEATFAHFAERGRRAVAVMAEVGPMVQRLRAQAQVDPFAAAVLLDVHRDLEAVAGLELRPAPSLGEELSLAHVTTEAPRVRVDVVMGVTASEVRFGFVPHVRFDDEGHPELVAAGVPILPHTVAVPFPRTLRPFPGPLGALRDALAAHVPEGAVIGLGTTSDAPAHLVTRAWLSAEAAERTPGVFVAADAGDTLRGVPMRGRHGPSDAARQLFVRLGGHSVKTRGGGSVDIPRVRSDNGRLHFDYATLESRLAGDRTTSVRFMSSLDGQSLTTTVFLAAPARRPLVLELP